MTVAMSSREPYGRLLGDDKYLGPSIPQALCYPLSTHAAQVQYPWHALSGRHTISSARKQSFHFDPSVPKDDLDFIIKSDYDHQSDLFKSKSQAMRKSHIYDESRGYVFANRIKWRTEPEMPMNHPLIVTRQAKKENIHSMKSLLSGHHINASRHGYSRKPPNGGMFL